MGAISDKHPVARVAMAEKRGAVPSRVLACGSQIGNRDRVGDRDLQRELRGRANRGMDVVSLLTCPACRGARIMQAGQKCTVKKP